ncbi:MAG: heme-binding domain-containing protein [Myxococcota bacterium]
MASATLRRIGLAVPALLLLAQLIRPERTNPPVTADIGAPQEIAALLRRACYDCHSNETVWPWYAQVAPVSWLLARDVNEGRRELNFSSWDLVKPGSRGKKLKRAAKEARGRDMPPWFYLPMHPEARLSDAELATLTGWLDAASTSTLSGTSSPAAPSP